MPKFSLLPLLVVAICFNSSLSRAQNNAASIKGRVTMEDGKPASGATVILTRWKEQDTIKKMTTDTAGMFLLDAINAGQYKITITWIGYKEQQLGPVSLRSGLINIPDVTMLPLSKNLQEVIVTAKKNVIEQKADRTVVNVNAMISSTGLNALEVLQRSPGILVDENGNITYQGKAGVTIMIDDKPTYLSGENLVAFLRSLPASQLDQIELMATPPARYDASGNAGMINIKTRKIKTKGLNGNTAATAGINNAGYLRTLESIVLNYRVNKFNLFANAGYGIQNNYRQLDVNRFYYGNTGNLVSAYSELARFHPLNYNRNLKLGMDYAASSKTTLGIVLTGALTTGTITAPTRSAITNSIGKTDSLILADNHTGSRFGNMGVNLNVSQALTKPSQLLTMDLDYVRYDSRQDQSFLNRTFDAADSLTYTQAITDELPTFINIYAVKTDYVQPLRAKAKLEAGIKTSFVGTDNGANYFHGVNGVRYPDYGKTNRFLYNENINAAYISYSNELKRLSIKLGLRMENSNSKAHQLGNPLRSDSAFEGHYTDLFPTAYFSYKLDSAGSNVLNLSLGRRIDRPGYKQLNPFVTYVDKYSTWVGNPFLRPQYATSFQLTYAYKSIFSISLQYSDTKDFQSEVDLQEGDTFVAHSYNLAHAVNKSISLYVGLPLTQWWTFNVNSDLVNNSYEGTVPGLTLKTGMTYLYGFLNNSFSISKQWSAELGVWYNSALTYAQFVRRPLSQTNLGLAKKILHNKGVVKLNLQDMFRTYIPGGNITNIPGVAATYQNDFANRSITLGFTYNFGSDTNTKKTRKTGSSETEQSRIGQ